MTRVVALRPKAIDLRINLDSATADRVAVSECARFVKSRIKEVDAAQAWISAGKALSELRSYLQSVVPDGDKSRIGWSKAFDLGEFAISRETADALIDIYNFFRAAPHGVLTDLPPSWQLLHLIAKTFSLDVVVKYTNAGVLSAFVTEHHINSLAARLRGDIPATPKRKIALPKRYVAAMSAASKHDRILAVCKLMSELRLELKDLDNA